MLRFYIEKREELGVKHPAFKKVMEFADWREASKFIDYHRHYITKLETLASFPTQEERENEPQAKQEILCEVCGGVDCHLEGCGAKDFDSVNIYFDGDTYRAYLSSPDVKFQAQEVTVLKLIPRVTE